MRTPPNSHFLFLKIILSMKESEFRHKNWPGFKKTPEIFSTKNYGCQDGPVFSQLSVKNDNEDAMKSSCFFLIFQIEK